MMVNSPIKISQYYDKIAKLFPVLKTSMYDLKWDKTYIRAEDMCQEIENDIARGDKSIDDIFGKYYEPVFMENLYRNKDLEFMEYIANCKDNFPGDSLLSCNNADPMYTYCKVGKCECYDNITSIHMINDITCTCEKIEDDIKYVHVVTNVSTARGIFAYFPRIYPKKVGIHDGLLSAYSQLGYCGMENIDHDKKIYIKLDTLNYKSVIEKDPTNNEMRVMEVSNLDMIHYLAEHSNIKVVCIGIDGLNHASIIFPHMPFTYKKINSLMGSLIKYVRHIQC